MRTMLESAGQHCLVALLCALSMSSLSIASARAAPPDLPEPRANNPLARLQTDSGALWFTGLGIAPGKTWRDLRGDGWWWRAGEVAWQPVPPVPAFDGRAGRLGSHAVAVAGAIHVIGGYTVAEDHAERSTPGVWRLEIEPEARWVRAATMPVPVDDSVALVHQDRFVYLVSGWSDTGNVNLVQVRDAVEHSWTQAEPWPGRPVFGHAGGIVDGRIVVCGGAAVDYLANGPRQFVESDACWLGTIRADDHRRLDWKPLTAMPGGSRYRAAAIGIEAHGAARVVFAGGADRPYNYDGQGYDGVPAAAFDSVVSYNLDAGRWECHRAMPEARMDLRGVVAHDGALVLAGGMDDQRRVTDDVMAFTLSEPRPCIDRAAP